MSRMFKALSLAALLVLEGLCIAGNLSPERVLVRTGIFWQASPLAPWLGCSPPLMEPAAPHVVLLGRALLGPLSPDPFQGPHAAWGNAHAAQTLPTVWFSRQLSFPALRPAARHALTPSYLPHEEVIWLLLPPSSFRECSSGSQ